MMDSAQRMEVGEPAPGAHGHPILLAFGVIASPVAWVLALYALFAIASHNCFPGATPRPTELWDADWLLGAIAGGALVVCVVAGLVSYCSWRMTYEENPSASATIQFGEGRTRFLAIWGALTSLLFGILMVVSLIPLFVVPTCGS
jgi:heme/copper-type cytochrome/quinol oxidase subunit 2